ncbi:MAG: hypothetical protein GY869_28440, partial [Planctomycetes bacterium]|nr:hypothetical protein [Planctomycetota bacterium]
MAKNNELPDEYVRRQFYVIGLGNRLGDEFVTELNKSNRDSRGILYDQLPEIYEKRPLSKIRSRLLENLADEIAVGRDEHIDRYRQRFEEELALLIAGEFKKSNQAYADLPDEVAPIEEEEDSIPFIPLILTGAAFDGLTMDQWFDGFKESDRDRVYQSISAGVNNGESEKEIVTGLLGTKQQRGKDGALSASQNSARRLSRTVTAGVANTARTTWARSANKKTPKLKKKDGLDLVEVYSAVLDSRTSFICASLNGNVYEVGIGPIPPLHPNCRSARYPIPRVLANPNKLKVDGMNW